MTRPCIGVVLAAGKGTRLKSDLPKVLHPVLGKPMLQRVLESLAPLGLEKVIIVIGHQAQRVEAMVGELTLPFPVAFVVQEPQLGTGHAVMQVEPVLPRQSDVDVLVTCGDMPLIPTERYQTLLSRHAGSQAAVSLVSVALPDPTGYGRIIRENGEFRRIVEEKDASPEEKRIAWVNAGIYVGHWPIIAEKLTQLNQNNAQGEFYFTDVMGLLAQQSGQGGVAVVEWPEPDEVLGINSRQHLAQAGEILSRWTCNRLMEEGVSIVNPASQTLAPEVSIGPDTVIQPGCVLEGSVTIGHHGDIGPNTTMRGTIQVGNHCRVVSSMLERAVTVGDHSYIGPFAHLRDNAVIGQQVRIGNFVEVKETRFGSRSNAAHLCYLGDAVVGDDVNMGAGSIIANYDPILDVKHQTVIEDGVKVGCNSVLISPVILGKQSSVAAGSVITKDVQPQDLAIARCRQSAIEQWVAKKLTQKNSHPVS